MPHGKWAGQWEEAAWAEWQMKGSGNAGAEVERATGSDGQASTQTQKHRNKQTNARAHSNTRGQQSTFMKPATKARNNNKLALANCLRPPPNEIFCTLCIFRTILYFVVTRNKAWHSCCTYNTLKHRGAHHPALGQQAEMTTRIYYESYKRAKVTNL